MKKSGLPPVVDENTEILILGTLPSDMSIAAQQYYANPGNDFWKLVGAALDKNLDGLSYEKKLDLLKANCIGLWDAYQTCFRPGSMDADITETELNDFTLLKGLAPKLRLVCFNGHGAAGAKESLVRLGYQTRLLPSSSGANRKDQVGRLEQWRTEVRCLATDFNSKYGLTLEHSRCGGNMKQKFRKRYQEEWNALLRHYPIRNVTEQPTNPLLLDVPTSYFAADVRVMVFGQETNDWEGVFPHEEGVEHILKTYETFYTERQCYRRGGHWWNGIKKLVGVLEGQTNASGKSIAVLWNNLIKVGEAEKKGMPTEGIRDWQRRWFDVTAWEVNELNPNLVIFFSGPHYDWFIQRIFDDAQFQTVNGRTKSQFARVKSRNLPLDSIRTYHPNYLWRHGFYEYLADIVGAIRL